GFHPTGNQCAANDGPACCGPTCATCPGVSRGTAQCRGGACDFVCDFGFYKEGAGCAMDDNAACCGAACSKRPAPPNPSPRCQANLLTDPQNCGGCASGPKDPRVCAGGGSQPQACVNGQCGCPENWGNCNGEGNDGCEVNLLTSNVHCGACNPSNPSEADLLT